MRKNVGQWVPYEVAPARSKPFDQLLESADLQAFCCEADEGTRTLDLLHGKVTHCFNWVDERLFKREKREIAQHEKRRRALICARGGQSVPYRPRLWWLVTESVRRFFWVAASTLLMLSWLWATLYPWWVFALVAAVVVFAIASDERKNK